MGVRTGRVTSLVTAVTMMGSLVVAPMVARGGTGLGTDVPDAPLQPTFSIGRSGALSSTDARKIVAAVESTGARGNIVRFGAVGMTRHSRGDRVLERLTGRWRIPLATVVVPIAYVRDVGGDEMAQVLVDGRIILGRKAAGIRGAEVGDVLVLRDRKFRAHEFVVGAVVDEPFVDWNEVLMSEESAAVLGDMNIVRVTITNVSSYARVISALSRAGFPVGDAWRIRRSWDLENPDGTLGLASTKKLLGEFAFKPVGGNVIRMSQKWLSANISWKHRFSGIPLSFNCNKVVAEKAQGALSEIAAAGLAQHIDVRNSNRYGGCYVGRYNRRAGVFGSPSRHSWGMAIDMNTVTNAQGATPHMNCDVVRIFRKWGFAWGGNFWPRDGMHFEYVGEPRDTLAYPSRYCPNNVPIPTTTLPRFPGAPSTTVPTTTGSTTTSSVPVTSSTVTVTSSP